MKAGWKFVLFLYNLLLIAVGGAMVLIGAANYLPGDLMRYYSGTTQQRVGLCIVGIVIIFFALVMVMVSLSGKTKRIESIVLLGAQGGQISLSVDAIKSMVAKAVNQVSSVREIKTEILSGPNGVKVKVTLAIVGGGNFVSLSDQVQTTIRDYLSQTAGLRVEEVIIMIHESSAPVKVASTAVEETAEADLKQEG